MVTRNWRAEVETAQVYRDLAGREKDEKRKGILIRMAEAEERHAQRWEKKLRDLGAEPPVLENTFGAVSIAGGTRSPGPTSRFAAWKRPRKNTKRNFAINATARWPEKKTCEIFCGKARSKKKRMRAP